MRERSHARAGFTLLEVMMALVITGLVLAMVYSSFTAVMETRERVTAATDTNMTARLLLSRMVREIESAFIVQRGEDAPPESRYTHFDGDQNEIDGMAADRISFTTFAHTKRGMNADESDQGVISYESELFPSDDGSEDTLAIIRREWRRVAPAGETQTYQPVPIPIAEGIEGFRLRFLEEGGNWVTRWDSTDLRTLDALPAAVEITLSLADGLGGVKEYLTVASPRIDPIVRDSVLSAEGETVIDDEEDDEEINETEDKASGETPAEGGTTGGRGTGAPAQPRSGEEHHESLF